METNLQTCSTDQFFASLASWEHGETRLHIDTVEAWSAPLLVLSLDFLRLLFGDGEPELRSEIWEFKNIFKVEKNLKGGPDLISSPWEKFKSCEVWLRCRGKTLLGVVNKHLKTKSLLTSPSNALSYYLKKTFPPTIWIFPEVMGSNPGYPVKSFLLYPIWVFLPHIVSKIILIERIFKLFWARDMVSKNRLWHICKIWSVLYDWFDQDKIISDFIKKVFCQISLLISYTYWLFLGKFFPYISNIFF